MIKVIDYILRPYSKQSTNIDLEELLNDGWSIKDKIILSGDDTSRFCATLILEKD